MKTSKSLIFLVIIFICGCNLDSKQKHISFDTKLKSDKNISKLSDIKTPNGQTIKFEQTDKALYLKWQSEDSLRTLNYPFPLDAADAWLPKLIAESDKYLFLRAGCGNPCWIGIVLPLFKNGEPKIIHEYIACDLNAELAASVFSSDSIEITNIKSGARQFFSPEKCESEFLGYCIDTAYFKDNMLCYSWTSETYLKSVKRETLRHTLVNNWH